MSKYVKATEAADKISKELNIPMNKLVDIFAKIPRADVKEVKHGKWLTWEEQFPDRKPTKKNNLGVFCNNCHSHADNMTDFCPNCGARMDGDDNAFNVKK